MRVALSILLGDRPRVSALLWRFQIARTRRSLLPHKLLYCQYLYQIMRNVVNMGSRGIFSILPLGHLTNRRFRLKKGDSLEKTLPTVRMLC